MTLAMADLSPVEVDPQTWGAQVRETLFPPELSSVDRLSPFVVDAQLDPYAGFKIARVKASAHAAKVSGQGCGKSAQRFVKVIWQQSGGVQLEQAGREVDIAAGSWTVYEASRGYSLRMTNDASFVAFLCETANNDSLIKLAQRACGRAMPTAGGAAVALAAVSTMRSQGELVTPKSRAAVLDFVAKLLWEELHAAEGGQSAARRRTQQALLCEAQQYIRANLDRHDLSPDQIAHALHVSRRTLYHAFEFAGVTPKALVQQLRLDRCREMLSHFGAEASSVTQVALELGFSDPAYFARVFRQRFGQTPSAFRAFAQSGRCAHS